MMTSIGGSRIHAHHIQFRHPANPCVALAVRLNVQVEHGARAVFLLLVPMAVVAASKSQKDYQNDFVNYVKLGSRYVHIKCIMARHPAEYWTNLPSISGEYMASTKRPAAIRSPTNA